MWAQQQKELLSIIYGNVVVARNEEKDKCKLVTQEGELILKEDVLAVGYFSSSRGFRYVVINEQKKIEQ